MNARERFPAIMNFEEPDRNFVWEFGYWGGIHLTEDLYLYSSPNFTPVDLPSTL